MSRARELTMGPKRKRTPSTIAASAEWRALTRIVNTPEPPDPDQLAALITAVGLQPGRMRMQEGIIYTRACELQARLTPAAQ